MTKKDYIKAAEIVNRKWNVPKGCFAGVDFIFPLERAFIDFFKNDNARFDEQKFLAACRKGSEIAESL